MGVIKIWIVRFISYDGPAIIEGYFRTEKAARKVFTQVGEKGPAIRFKDDFGIEIKVDSSMCARVLTNTEASAAFHAAITTANADAAQVYGFPMKLDPGSTIQ